MAYYQPTDLLFAQWGLLDRFREMAEKDGNKKEGESYKKLADEVWERRERLFESKTSK